MIRGDLKVEATKARCNNGRVVDVLQPDTVLWALVRALGEQVIMALDELGYVRTDEVGRTHGFKIKELSVDPEGKLAVFHLDVTSARLFEPTAKAASRGKPVPSLTLTNDKVLDQIRVRISEVVGGRVDVWKDNHYYVRYVVDLDSLQKSYGEFPSGNLIDHLGDVPGPFTVPLGLDRAGKAVWLDMVKTARHALLTGTTGGGKTTWMDATICSLVQNTPSDQLKLVFIDPQKLNFSPYRSLTAYRFTDREGTLGLVQEPADIVSAMVRLDEEHLRRTDLIARTPWGDVEGYNAHAAPEDQLPYVFIFVDELTVLKVALERAQKSAVKSFDLALKSLIAGARKVGFRVFLCLQYLHRNTIPPDIAAQAALNLAFWNSQQGSQNSLGDWAASALPGKGRFIVEGLPGGRQTLQGMYVDRDTVLELINTEIQSPTQPMDELVKNVINYALEQGGQLPESKVFETFGHLTSRRQVGNLLQALERVGLVLPANLKTVPPEPRRLKVSSLDEAANVLKFHPEIRFREVPGDSKLRFGPGTA